MGGVDGECERAETLLLRGILSTSGMIWQRAFESIADSTTPIAA
jgi:hypothetical protein